LHSGSTRRADAAGRREPTDPGRYQYLILRTIVSSSTVMKQD